ncbi:ral guanine nucleotide dissociation stimulator-like [Dipodomys spectabilis]|uniref:ral guanine nucleotide dissociation stimulator-like n=1 Tax=Dipodomys spectabilis TaxID=105255 RepID=UPI001C54B71B|nr:ral guanine nucleotide dissociation stimulator-like [Dipodomys spectabilis]
MLVMNLVPAYQKGNLFYVGNFLHNYRHWGTMEQVLDIVFKNSLCSIFTMWMDCYPADFREPQNRHPVKELTHYAMLHMPSSDLVLHLHLHLDELEETGKNETKKQRKKSLCGHLRACLETLVSAKRRMGASVKAVDTGSVASHEATISEICPKRNLGNHKASQASVLIRQP